MRILDLAFKDLSQILRDKRSLLFLVAMPLVFTLFMGFAYRGDGEAVREAALIPLGWVNADPGGKAASLLEEQLAAVEGLELVELAPETAEESLQQGDVAGVLFVPAGFSAQAAAGELAQLTLLADVNTPAGQSLYQLVRRPVAQLFSSFEIARLSAQAVGGGDVAQAATSAAAAWRQADTPALVQVKMVTAAPEAAWYGDTPYNQASPGILVQFAIFGLVTAGQILVQERKDRTLQRMLTTSMPAWQIVAGHLLAMFTLVFLQEALLIIFGQLALGVDYLRAPLAVLLVAFGLALWVAAMGMLIGVVARNDSQVVLIALMAMFLFSALGGTWFPLEGTGGAFAAIGRLMPSAWAMIGFQNVLMRGLGVASAWTPLLVLLGYAAGFFALASWLFRRLSA